MKYDLSKPMEANKARAKFDALAASLSMVDIKKIYPKRTIKQNAYLHVCITLYAIECGYTLEEAKTILKRECGFMTYEKKGQRFLKHTSMMDTEELTKFIEWIRTYAGRHGIYIPTADEYIMHQYEIDKTISQNEEFLT